MTAFELDGQKVTAIKGGPAFKFTEEILLVVRGGSPQEVDQYWSKLAA